MKRKLLKFITAAIMLAAVISLVSCSSTDEYDELDAKGYTVSVKFDANGGQFKGTDSTVIDVFDPSKAPAEGIALLAPDDPKRDKNNTLSVGKYQHFLAGWYSERTPIDENDLTKGYTYSGKWDFDTDRIEIDPDGSYTSRESVLTLYAVWIPYYEFEVYAKDGDGFQLVDTVLGTQLDIPAWGDGDVKLDMGDFPERSGYTLDAVYTDEAMTSAVSGTVTGVWDEATGTSLTPKIKLYTSWLEGDRYRIYKADDLRKNVKPGGYYDIMADLDFTGMAWPTAFASGKFSGRIYGNGHTIKGITVTADGKKTMGVFGTLMSGALIENISFEDVTFVANFGIIGQGSSFGSFAGVVQDGVSIEGVSLKATIEFTDMIVITDFMKKDCVFGTVVGTGSSEGIDASVVLEKQNPEDKFDFAVDGEDKITFTYPL